MADLKKLARNVIEKLEDWYENCFSDLNRLLSKCFDFGQLFVGLCGERSDRTPVDNRRFSELGVDEFQRCSPESVHFHRLG